MTCGNFNDWPQIISQSPSWEADTGPQIVKAFPRILYIPKIQYGIHNSPETKSNEYSSQLFTINL
jgi:hypothetical protein